MAQRQTSADRYVTASELQQTGYENNQEAWKNAGFFKKMAASLGLGELYDMADDFITGRPSQQRAYDLDMAKLLEQERYQTEMWEKENAYNATPAQLQRWMAAGGNPNAFFGGGTNTGNASSLGAPSGGSGAGTTVGNIQGAISTATEAAKSFWENRKTKAEAEGKELENGTYKEITENQIKLVQAQTALAQKQGKLTDEQANQIKELLPGLKGKTNAEWDKLKEETKNLIQQRDQIKQQIKYLKEDTRNKVLQNEKLEWEKLFRETYGVDPMAGPIQMLIQNIISGKGTQVLETLMDYMDGENGTKELADRVTEKIDKMPKRQLKAILYGNPGAAGVIYSAHVNRNRKKWRTRTQEK